MGGERLPLYVGQRPELTPGQDLSTYDYIKAMRASSVPLSDQGDGVRSYATVLINALGSVTASVLLLDEPEAFLHPPQARLLAEVISSGNLSVKQFFIATHSVDVLSGLLSTQSSKLKIVKLGRADKGVTYHVLDRHKTSQIARDPLLKFSGVLSAVFHSRTIICEGDSDCLFYNAVLDIPSVRDSIPTDTLFIHGGGKHRIPQLMDALQGLGATFDVICDIDVLNDGALLKKIIMAAGGDWSEFEAASKAFSFDLSGTKRDIPDGVLITTLRTILEEAESAGRLDDKTRARIRETIAPLSLWEEIKRGGKQALPAGEASQRFQLISEKLRALGVWIVPVGTVEGFCKSVPGKTGWVQQVLQSKDLQTDDELAVAREFVSDVWRSRPVSATPVPELPAEPDPLPILDVSGATGRVPQSDTRAPDETDVQTGANAEEGLQRAPPTGDHVKPTSGVTAPRRSPAKKVRPEEGPPR